MEERREVKWCERGGNATVKKGGGGGGKVRIMMG